MLKNILFVNILLDSLGWSVIIPSLPNIHEILELNTVTIGSMYSAISLLAFLSSTMQGVMLDYFGTQKMLYLSPISQLIGFSMIIVSIQLKSIPLFVVGRCLPAFFKCGMVVSQAVLYDLSGPESIRDFGALFAFSNIAYIIGPVVGGFIYSLHPFAPYITSMITASLSLLLLYCIPAKQDTFRRTASMEKIEKQTIIKETPDNKATPTSSTWKNPTLFYYLHIKFAFQIGIATFEAFFGQYSRTYAGLNSRSIGLILGLYGTLALFTNLYIIKGLLSIISPKKLEFFFIPLILVLGTSLSIWSQTKSLTVVLFAVSILSVAGNLFQLIVQNRIASTQEVEIPIRTTVPSSPKPDESLVRLPSNEEIPLDKEIIVEEPVVVSGTQQMREKKSEKQKTIGAVFGMSAAADRAARIVSPMIGSFFLQLYGSNGIFFVASLITVYCVGIVFYTSPLKLLSLFDSHEESLLSVSKKID
jgi:MFS family permease